MPYRAAKAVCAERSQTSLCYPVAHFKTTTFRRPNLSLSGFWCNADKQREAEREQSSAKRRFCDSATLRRRSWIDHLKANSIPPLKPNVYCSNGNQLIRHLMLKWLQVISKSNFIARACFIIKISAESSLALLWMLKICCANSCFGCRCCCCFEIEF